MIDSTQDANDDAVTAAAAKQKSARRAAAQRQLQDSASAQQQQAKLLAAQANAAAHKAARDAAKEQAQAAQAQAQAQAQAEKTRNLSVMIDKLAEGGYEVSAFADNTVTTTKYTVLNFVPFNLWEQFHRLANIWFAIVSVIQLTSGVSPTSSWATIVPLGIVVFITMIKDFYEDYRRYLTDLKVNSRECYVVGVTSRQKPLPPEFGGPEREVLENLGGGTRRGAGRGRKRGRSSTRNSGDRRAVAAGKGLRAGENSPSDLLDNGAANLLSTSPSSASIGTATSQQSGATSGSSAGSLGDESAQPGGNEPFPCYIEKNVACLRKIQWRDLQVGHVVYLQGDQPVPADMICKDG